MSRRAWAYRGDRAHSSEDREATDPARAPRRRRSTTYEWFRAKEDAAVIAHLEAENAYTEARTAHLAGLREQIFDEIKGRTLETDLSVPTRRGRLVVLRPHGRGQQYGIQCRAPLASADDWTPPSSRPMSDGRRASRCCSTATSRPRATSSSRSAASRSPTDGRRCSTASTSRATSATRSACATWSPASSCPTRSPAPFAGATFSPDGRFIVYTTVDDAVATRHGLAARARHAGRRRREALPRARRAVLARRGLHPQRPLPRDRAWARRSPSEEWLAGCRRPAGEPRVVWPRNEGVEYDVDARRGRRRGRAVHPAQRRRPGLRAGAGRGIRPRRARARSSSRTAPASGCSGCRRFRDWGVVGYRRGGLRAASGMLRLRATRRGLHELEFDEPLYSVGVGRQPRVGAAAPPPRLRLVRHARRRCTTTRSRRASCCCASASPCSADYDARRLRAGAGVGDRAGRHADPDLARVEARRSATPAPRRAHCTSTATARTSTRSTRASRSRACRSSTAA